MVTESPASLKLEIVRVCPGLGFSMLESAVCAVGREDIFVNLSTHEAVAAGRRPVLAIPAGGTWNFFPDGDGPGVVGMLRRARETLGSFDGLQVAFDCAGEGFAFRPADHAAFAAEMARFGLDPEQCFLITSRTDGRTGYAQWCRANDQAPLFDPIYSPIQLYYFSGQYRAAHNLENLSRFIAERSPVLSGIRPRKYVCLNFMPRYNRWAIVLRLMDEGLMGEGFVSFHGRVGADVEAEGGIELDVIKAQLRRLSIPKGSIDRIEELDAMAPLELDEPKAERFEKAYAVADHAYYAESYFSIVTESDFDGFGGQRFSEKVLKPIANLQPFVSLGTVGTMAELRRLGFQTFSPLIDESYDTIEDPAERLRAGIEAALKLIRLRTVDLHALYAELWPRVVHNYMHFLCASPALVDRDEALRTLSLDFAPS